MTRDTNDPWTSLGLLVLRLGTASLLIFGHGWRKLIGFSDMASRFANPIGLGSEMSLVLVVITEIFCSALLILGLWTRLAVIPYIIMTLVLVFIHHAGDPWAKKELALLYFVPAVTLLLTGGGLFSLDALLFGRKKKS